MLVTTSGGRLPLDAEVADDDIEWFANEGIRVSALVVSLAEQRPIRSINNRSYRISLH
jgi:hypothetical protein